MEKTYWRFHNAHPKGLLVGDCVKRAITTATDKDYMDVQRALNRMKKITHCAKFNEDRNYHSYLTSELHMSKTTYPAEKGKPRMNGKRFCDSHPNGSYILVMAGHLTACKDGIIYDTWDCTEKCVYGSYKVI